MTLSSQSETLMGSYRMVRMEVQPGVMETILCVDVKLPSGQVVPVPVEYQTSAKPLDFGTDTHQPAEWDPQTGQPVRRDKPSRINQLDAWLGATIGNPKDIVAAGAIAPEVFNRCGRGQIDAYITAAKTVGTPEWTAVLPLLRAWYLAVHRP